MKIAALLIVAAWSGGIQLAYSETEPNNSANQANKFAYDGSQTGNLTGTDLADWFYIDIPEAGIWQLNINKTGTGTGFINLRGGETIQQDLITSYTLSSSETPPGTFNTWSVALLPGRYFIEIKKSNNSIHYILASQLIPSSWSSDKEPNDYPANATTIGLGDSLTGTLHYHQANAIMDQNDWYVMDMPQGGFYRMTAHKRGLGNGWIYLRDPLKVGYPECTNLYFQYFESPDEGWEWYFPVLKGRYYLNVGNGSGIVNYKIINHFILPPFPEDQEPNDSQLQALPFQLNDTISGILGHHLAGVGFADTTDWFKITVPDKRKLDFFINKKTYSNAHFQLRNETKVLAQVYTDYGDQETELHYIAEPGTYYFRIIAQDLFCSYRVIMKSSEIINTEQTEEDDSPIAIYANTTDGGWTLVNKEGARGYFLVINSEGRVMIKMEILENTVHSLQTRQLIPGVYYWIWVSQSNVHANQGKLLISN